MYKVTRTPAGLEAELNGKPIDINQELKEILEKTPMIVDHLKVGESAIIQAI